VRLVWHHDDMTGGEELPADAPEKPESAFVLWAGTVGVASGSVFLNTYHDTLSLKVVAIGILVGFLPPFVSATTIHAAKIISGTWAKVGVFLVTVGAMVVSARGASFVLEPAYQGWGSYLYSVVLDGADLLLLYAIMQHYDKVREYRKWVKSWLAAQGRNQPAGPGTTVPVTAGTAPVPEPGTGAVVPVAPAPVRDAVPAVVPEPAPGTVPVPPEPSPVPDVVPVAVPAVVPPVVPEPAAAPAKTPEDGTRGPGREQKPSQSASAKAELQALRQRLVQEFADRPRPVMEDASHRTGRAARFLAEFRQKTGVEMNNAELGKALRVSKATAGEIRSDVAGPGGEQPAAGEEATA
jgi:hypothetical protein